MLSGAQWEDSLGIFISNCLLQRSQPSRDKQGRGRDKQYQELKGKVEPFEKSEPVFLGRKGKSSDEIQIQMSGREMRGHLGQPRSLDRGVGKELEAHVDWKV